MAFQILTAPSGVPFYLQARLAADAFGTALPNLSDYAFAFLVIDGPTVPDPDEVIEASSAEGEGITVSGLYVRVKLTPEQIALLELDTTYYFYLQAKADNDGPRIIEQGLIARIASPTLTFPDATVEIVTDEGGAQITTEDGAPIATG